MNCIPLRLSLISGCAVIAMIFLALIGASWAESNYEYGTSYMDVALLLPKLLVVIPYKMPGDVAEQENPGWIAVANDLADYKTDTGLTTRVITLNQINSDYEGVDEPERVKQAIYDWAVHFGTRYVMLVGNADLFPVRYQLVGYSADEEIAYSNKAGYCDGHCPYHPDDCTGEGEDRWCAWEGYSLIACDAYYANLWDDGDARRTFDDWNADHDEFFGELYCNDYHGIDGATFHPDVAVGRVPAQNPDEFRTFVEKVMVYERERASSPGVGRALLIASDAFDSSIDSNKGLGGLLTDYAVTYLEQAESGAPYSVVTGDAVDTTDDPQTFIANFINDNNPHFVNFAGHGSHTWWGNANFYRWNATRLENEYPLIAGAASCSTAAIAHKASSKTMFTEPVPTETAYSMSDAFLTRSLFGGGGVAYVGGLTTVQPQSFIMDRAFFEAIAEGAATTGEAWLDAVEAYIDHYSLDTLTPPDPVYDDAHPDGRYWNGNGAKTFHHVYKMNFSGDPSLRLVSPPTIDDTPPLTAAVYVRRVHVDPDFRYVGIRFRSADAGSGVFSTRYRYRVGKNWTPWLMGTEVYVPVLVMPEGKVGRVIIEYYSMDRMGNREARKKATIAYDTVVPKAETQIINAQIRGKVLDEKGRPLAATLVLSNQSLQRANETDAEGRYVFSDLPAGTYTLRVNQAPVGYRQLVPDKPSYTIVIHTNRMERVFVFAREDHVAPSMTQELTWDAVVAHGCVYGLAYDDWYGTGVSQVRLAVTDAGTRWLSDKETWQNQETWFAPQHILPLNEFLESHLEDKLLERLPEEIRQELRSKVENIPCQLNHEYQPRIWLHCFKDLSLLGGDMKVVRGRVIDHAGNHSLMESVDIRMTADFEAEPVAAPLALKFRDRSQGFVVECHWDFGDGHTSAKANPTHKYAAPGTYKVSLTICGPYASDHVVREISVRRTEQAPK